MRNWIRDRESVNWNDVLSRNWSHRKSACLPRRHAPAVMLTVHHAAVHNRHGTESAIASHQNVPVDGWVRMRRRTVGLLSALAKERETGLSDQLVEVVRELIIDGVWKPGQKLPGSRLIARDAKVSRSKVLAAIDTLAAESLREPRDRSGTYVAWANGGQNDQSGGLRPSTSTRPPPINACFATS